MIELIDILRIGVENKASDIHLTVGRAPSLRINGRMRPIEEKLLLRNVQCSMLKLARIKKSLNNLCR